MTADAPRSSPRRWLVAIVLACATFGLYWRTGEFEFINYDDNVYITDNPFIRDGLTSEGVSWAFETFHAGNWHPLTWLSHMADVSLFGVEDARGPHLVNAALHGLTAAFIFLALLAMTRALGPSLFTAAFFALHPLRVESVAWVAERKDVLAGVLWAATMLAYAGYARRGGTLRYVLVAGLFALGLLAKPMLVTLPCVLLLLDLWPLRRDVPVRKLVLEKLGLLALVVPYVVVTLRAQDAALQALDLSLAARLANAFESCGVYLASLVWPTELALLYPHAGELAGEANGASSGWGAAAIGCATLVVIISAAAWVSRRRLPCVLVGWLWFLGTLVPVIGIVQVGIHAHADRYTYIPSIGVTLALAFAVFELTRSRPALRRGAAVAGTLWVAALVPVTWTQIGTWRSSITAMEHAIAVTENNYMAHTNLAQALEGKGRFPEAIEHYRTAIGIKGNSTLSRYQLGRALAITNRLEEARDEFQAALDSMPEPPKGRHPEYFAALVSLGITASRLGDDAGAVLHLSRAYGNVNVAPGDRVSAGQALAWTLATSPDDDIRDGPTARAIAEACIKVMPTPQLLETLAAAHAESREWEQAVQVETRALSAIPPAGQAGAQERLRMYRSRRPYRKP